MPRARSLYGSLPDQLRDRHSFANGLRRLLRLRSKYGIASARQIDVPDVAHPGMLVLVHEGLMTSQEFADLLLRITQSGAFRVLSTFADGMGKAVVLELIPTTL